MNCDKNHEFCGCKYGAKCCLECPLKTCYYDMSEKKRKEYRDGLQMSELHMREDNFTAIVMNDSRALVDVHP